MTQRQIHSLMNYFEDQMENLILEINDEDNIEYESCIEWLNEKFRYYRSYLFYYQALYKDLKHPNKKLQNTYRYFTREEIYFVLRIKQLEEERNNV